MKVLAAHRAGLKTVYLPERNKQDLEDLPDDIKSAMQFIAVDRIDEVFDGVFASGTIQEHGNDGSPLESDAEHGGCDTQLIPLACKEAVSAQTDHTDQPEL
jgi:hypothetical protein